MKHCKYCINEAATKLSDPNDDWCCLRILNHNNRWFMDVEMEDYNSEAWQDDTIGFESMPIRYCPMCGRKLGGES